MKRSTRARSRVSPWAATVSAAALAAGLVGGAALPAQATPAEGGEAIAWGMGATGVATAPEAARTDVTAVALGWYHALALKTDGSIVSWGDPVGTVPDAANSGVTTAIDAGGGYSLALKADGSVLAWGQSSTGALDVPAAAQTGIVAVSAGAAHALALKDDGSVVAWGDDAAGATDVPDDAMSGVTAISAGDGHSLALKADGSVLAWGDDAYGQATVPEAAREDVTAISAGNRHSLALKADGSVVAWGRDAAGQATVPEAARSDVTAIAAGYNHSLALKRDGSVVAWGSNLAGESAPPAQAATGVTAVAAGLWASVALKAAPSAPEPALPPVPATGGQSKTVAAPSSVQPGAFESDSEIRVFGESAGMVLSAPLTVGGTTIPAGTRVNSYYVHADKVGSGKQERRYTGSVTFGSRILAVATTTADLRATAARFGSAGTAYPTTADQGVDVNDVAKVAAADRIDLRLAVGAASDALRVFTLAP
jgi:hypothetical protein